VGSATGKDGIGGASFASANITSESTEELPAVQVGDPFQEKKLLEACLEVIKTGAVAGMQDMGAAGIICSTAEMSAKGEVGMRVDLDKVPTRINRSPSGDGGMKPWELLLSESQERMLLVVEKGREKEVEAIFEKWDLPSAVIGEVTEDGLLSFYMSGVLEAQIPAQELVLGGGAPQYDRKYERPEYFNEIEKFDPSTIVEPKDLKSVAEQLVQLPSIAS
jgi:phosphoribosylformylglycinamidine synthase